MELINLVLPVSCSIDEIEDFKSEFLSHFEEIPGGAGLLDYEDIIEWVDKTNKDLSLNITSRVYLARRISDSKIVGIINLRYPYEGYVVKYGHIGYSVRPSERRKGIGRSMLMKCLIVAKEYGLFRVLITCDEENQGSKSIIEKCGGVQEVLPQNKGGSTMRFWVNTD